MSSTLEELIAKLNAYTPYQAMTQQEMEAAAQRRYQAVYDQKRLSVGKGIHREHCAGRGAVFDDRTADRGTGEIDATFQNSPFHRKFLFNGIAVCDPLQRDGDVICRIGE